jgi:hypothetical protein
MKNFRDEALLKLNPPDLEKAVKKLYEEHYG